MHKKKHTFFEFSGAVVRRYDAFNHLSTFGLDLVWRKKTAGFLKKFLSTQSGRHTVLDLACGTGDMAIAIQKYSSSTVIGIDPSTEMLHLFKKKSSMTQTMPIIVAVDDLPFRTGCFQAITCAFGFRNFIRLEHNLTELRRLLMPEGRIYILEFFRPEDRFIRLFLKIYSSTMFRFLDFVLNREIAPYDYLYLSIVQFYTISRFANLLTDMNYRVMQSKPFLGGVAHLIVAEKMG